MPEFVRFRRQPGHRFPIAALCRARRLVQQGPTLFLQGEQQAQVGPAAATLRLADVLGATDRAAHPYTSSK
jgi:hypothetical protein